MNSQAKQATPHSQLIAELLDSRVPKTEREHAAVREIERLRRERDEARAERDDLRGALHTCLWAMRQPLDGWKGDCERKAMDKANAALAQIEQERSK